MDIQKFINDNNKPFVLLTLLLFLFPYAAAQVSPEDALSTAQNSITNWNVGSTELKENRYEVLVLLENREIFKIKVSAASAEEAQRIVGEYLSKAEFGSPVLKKDVYEIPVLATSGEIAKLKVNAQTGDIITKKEKTFWQKMKGGSTIGYSLGIIGTVLVVISQFYSLRKRDVAIQKGSIKTWLKLHAYFGLLGPLLVLLHAGLPFEFKYAELFNAGTAGLSTYLMIIVVVSGFIGRHLYRLMDEGGKKLFKYWRDVHIPLVGVMFISIAIHIAKTLIED